MKQIAQVVSAIVLIVYCFYTLVGLGTGIAQFWQIIFPLAALGLTIGVLHYRAPGWLLFVSLGLNALFGVAALVIVVFFSPPLWWTIFVGLGACVGPAILNIVAITREMKVAAPVSAKR